MKFDEGYPLQAPEGTGVIYTCSRCKMPKWVPDKDRPGFLKKCSDHLPDCPRATGTYTHESGKKAGQVAANYSYKKK